MFSLAAGRSARRWGRQTKRRVSVFTLYGRGLIAIAAVGVAFSFLLNDWRWPASLCSIAAMYHVAVVRTKRTEDIKNERAAARRRMVGGRAELKTMWVIGWRLALKTILTLGILLYRALHDRKIPGSNANIDHLYICRRGAFNVDTKAMPGVWAPDSGTFSYNGHLITAPNSNVWQKTITTQWETSEIVEALAKKFGSGKIPVYSIWAIHPSKPLPWVAPITINGVRFCHVKDVASEFATYEGKLSRRQVREVTRYLRETFRPA